LRHGTGGLLELERYAVGVAHHLHRLAIRDVYVFHRREKFFGLLGLELAGCLPSAERGCLDDSVGRIRTQAIERVD